jgi:hypothetical protein
MTMPDASVQASSTVTTGARAPRRAQLARYATWQLRDYLRERGAATAIVILLFGWIGVAPKMKLISERLDDAPAALALRYGNLDVARATMVHDLSVSFLNGFIGSMIFLAALLAMNGIVANDRKLGYYRFLFSKPIAPLRYYGQLFAVNSAGSLALIALVALLYGALVTPVLTPSFIAGIAIVFLLYASISFALSAAVRLDWLSLVAVTVASTILWGVYGTSASPLSKLLYLLPPVHKTNDVYAAVADGTPLPWHTLGWIGGYAALCFVAGLLILRYRRLAIK